MTTARLHIVFGLLALTGCNRGAVPASDHKPAPAVVASTVATETVSAATDPTALLRGELPDSTHTAVLRARCEACHTLEYVTQQRLTDAQWDKTLTKMQKWGSQLTDDEKRTLGPYLAMTWLKSLPDRLSAHVAPPEGAVVVRR